MNNTKNFHNFYLENKDDLKVFCEVGVYFWNENGKNYSRLEQQVKDNKKVILVEPLPKCIENIKFYIGNKDNVILYPYAISDKNGKTIIYNEGASAFINEVRGKAPCNSNNYYDTPESRKIQESEIIEVETVTFDKIDSGDIDVLFIDIEGSEYFVIKNLVSRPKIISIESDYQNYINPYLSEIENWMKQNNYMYWYKTESDTFYKKYE